MTDTLPDLRDRLAARAAASPIEVAAARARLEGRLVRSARPRRHGRVWLVAAVAAVAVGLVSGAVVAVVHRAPAPTPAAARPALPVTDYLFDLDASRLAAAGLTAQFGGVDAANQRALVVPTGSPANTAYSAVVLVSYDAAGLDVDTRPADATTTTVAGDTGWTAPHTIAGDDTAYGIDGAVTTWTDVTGLTAKVVATDRTVLTAVTDAVELGRTHPVTFPASIAAGTFPAGSRLVSVEVDRDRSARIEIARPGLPLLAIAVNPAGANVQSPPTTEPFAAGFRLVVPRTGHTDLLTDGMRDLEVDAGSPVGGNGEPVLPLADLQSIVAALTFAAGDDPATWPTLVDAVPLT